MSRWLSDKMLHYCGGQEATVTVDSEPGMGGRGIHVIQENSKENVIMCQLYTASPHRHRHTTVNQNITTMPIHSNLGCNGMERS